MGRPGPSATDFVVADALQLLIIIDSSLAFAEADLWPKIDVDLDATVRRLADISSADSPLVEQEWPFDLGPGGPNSNGRFGRGTHAEHRHRASRCDDPGKHDSEWKCLIHRPESLIHGIPRYLVSRIFHAGNRRP